MKLVKGLLILFLPMFLVYVLNILIFNTYPVFFACFCGSPIYIRSLDKINSFNKLMDNFLHSEKEKLSNQDFINLVLIFILTFSFTGLIYILGNHDELGYPFGEASIIFLFMSYFKIPKKFFS